MTDKTLAEIIEHIKKMREPEGEITHLGKVDGHIIRNGKLNEILSYLNSLKKEVKDK